MNDPGRRLRDLKSIRAFSPTLFHAEKNIVIVWARPRVAKQPGFSFSREMNGYPEREDQRKSWGLEYAIHGFPFLHVFCSSVEPWFSCQRIRLDQPSMPGCGSGLPRTIFCPPSQWESRNPSEMLAVRV